MRARSIVLAVLAAMALCGLAGLAAADTVQKGNVRVKFEGGLTPTKLPREGAVPVRVKVGAKVSSTNGSQPPRLRKISIAINSAGHFSPNVVPVCTMRDIQPSTTQNALKACRSSLVGTGTFDATVLYPQQATFPSVGELYAFNGTYNGHPAILAHVYGTKPVPSSFTLPFVLTEQKGQLGTVLTASLPAVTGKAGYITGLSLDLDGSAGGGKGSYVTASCPAPKGINSAPFPFAQASFDFGSKKLSSTLTRTCKVRG